MDEGSFILKNNRIWNMILIFITYAYWKGGLFAFLLSGSGFCYREPYVILHTSEATAHA